MTKPRVSSESLLHALGDRGLSALLQLGTRRRYAAREVVVRQGDPATAVYVVVQGRLKVAVAAPDGREAALNLLGPGQVLGEVAVLDGGERSATVIALEESELLVIPRDAFVGYLESSSRASFRLLEVLARRLRLLTQRTEAVASLDVPERLARKLLELGAQLGVPAADGSVRLPVRLSQRDLGELISATRESVNKHLRAWQREGLIAQTGGRLALRNLPALRRRAALFDEV
jgi:CRP/FNR family transcriptional regulator, cyclic AMP receptor protein